jgi:PAS domain S-box-containing protein
MSPRLQTVRPQGFEVLAEAPIACHELDVEGRVVRINAAGCRLLGRAEHQVVGRYVWEFVAPEDRVAARERILSNLCSTESPEWVERNWVGPDGLRLVLEVHTVQIRSPGGRVVGLRTFLLDVTRRKRAEEALRKVQESLENRIKKRTAELELANQFLRREMEERREGEAQRRKLEAQIQHTQRLESLGVLAGGIAHDFNNLLASVMGYAGLAAMDLPEDSRARKSLDQVVIAARTASDLTEQMLAYSGRGAFVLEPVNLKELIEGVARLLESTLSRKATLKLHLAADLPCIHGDASQIRQVVMNLITNAAESLMDSAGTVEVTTCTEWADTGQLPSIERGGVLRAGTYISFEVKDTGCGMDVATLNKIFDPFFTTKLTGRGLGLAAVLGIVRGHHGSIEVHSEPEQGTTFRVLFPASSECAAPHQPGLASPAEWRAEGVVLVVDDQAPVRDLARSILERVGLTVLTADDGKQALEVFSGHATEIHAVLLDLNMPGMDGSEVLRIVKTAAPHVRVVLTSGFNEQDVQSKLEGGKPAGFLRKPYLPSDLVERLRAVW